MEQKQYAWWKRHSVGETGSKRFPFSPLDHTHGGSYKIKEGRRQVRDETRRREDRWFKVLRVKINRSRRQQTGVRISSGSVWSKSQK